MLIQIDPPHATGRRESLAWADAEPLVTTREAAALRRCSVATIWRDVAAGRLPPPTYLAPKRPRWRLRDVLPTAAPTAEAERIPARAAATAPAQ
jgi:predicted DNA-binding transcriptional regulator AlpA